MAPKMRPATPQTQRIRPITYLRFGLVLVRSPLLEESLICFLFLEVLRWFSSLGWLQVPMNSAQDYQGLPGRVSPFGHRRISLLPTTRRFSQVATSFIASRCQGIHHTPLVAWPKKLIPRSRCCHLELWIAKHSKARLLIDNLAVTLFHSTVKDRNSDRIATAAKNVFKSGLAGFGLQVRLRWARGLPSSAMEYMVEMIGIEPTTSGLQSRRSPN
jgi:hypothetical protein